MTSHPACCPNPETCELSYRDHLAGFGLSATAVPSRRVNRSPGVPDEPVTQTLIREKRWARDMAAFKRLHDQGLTPPRIDGSALRERMGKTEYDVTQRRVKIDYTDPR
jgi:hypothetical protein